MDSTWTEKPATIGVEESPGKSSPPTTSEVISGASERIPLRVLIVEDSDFDLELLLRLLRKGGYEPVYEQVETAGAMRLALQRTPWDIVLADYNLPQFSAPAALAVLQESGLDLPFIIVSGGIGENIAVAAMKAGAHDYLMKENLARLVPAIERELREAKNRAGRRQARLALRESELRYRLLWETATDAIIFVNRDQTIHFASPATEAVFGYKPDELKGRPVSVLEPPHLADQAQSIANLLCCDRKQVPVRAVETTGLKKDGTEFPVEVALSALELHGQNWTVGFFRDVSERKRAEATLRENQEQFRVAREIQQHLFPKKSPEVAGFEIAGASQPAEATGGDYFDYFSMLNGRVGIVIGDVTGHGVGPALLMAETRAYLRVLARNRVDVGEILTRTNLVLADDVGYERYITLLLAQLDPNGRTLSYANAGHPPAFVLSPEGDVRMQMRRTGVPLGISPDTVCKTGPTVPLHPGEIVLFLTDGFEEALGPDDEEFGIERVLEVVRKNRPRPAQEIVQELYSAVRRFSENRSQSDDLTVIVIKVTG